MQVVHIISHCHTHTHTQNNSHNSFMSLNNVLKWRNSESNLVYVSTHTNKLMFTVYNVIKFMIHWNIDWICSVCKVVLWLLETERKNLSLSVESNDLNSKCISKRKGK